MRRSLFTIIGVVAVLLMGLLAVLLSGGDNQTNNNTNENPAPAPVANDSKTKSETKIYYVSPGNVVGAGTLVGCNDGLVEKRVLIEGLNDDIKQTYERQLSLGNATESGLYNALARSKLKLENVRIEGDTALVNVSGELVTVDSCDRARVRAQLEYPARQFAGVSSVVVRINGYLLEELFR
jgi:hypothetical protein